MEATLQIAIIQSSLIKMNTQLDKPLNNIQGVSERTVQSVVLEPFRNLMVYRVE